MKKFFIIFLVIIIIGAICGGIIFYYFFYNKKTTNPPPEFNNDIKLHVVDVGQGEANFIELPDNKLIVLDTGDDLAKFKSYTINFFDNNQNYNNTIDYLLISHPDSDHLEGGKWLIENYDVSYCYMPRVKATDLAFTYTDKDGIEPIKEKSTVIYKNLFNAINTNNIEWEYFDESDIDDIKSLKIYDSSPSISYSNWNDYSPIIFMEAYASKYICISNDAETAKETWFNGLNVSYDCLFYIMGHHGSGTSSTANFLDKIKPQYVLYSANDLNGTAYGHPNINSLNRIVQYTDQIYGTDINGTIDLEIKDGTDYVSYLESKYTKTTKGWTGKNGSLIDITYP